MSVAKIAAGVMVVATVAGASSAHLSQTGAWAGLTRYFPAATGRPASPGASVQTVPQPVALQPAPTMAPSGASIALQPDGVGQYRAEVEIESQRLPVLVDTGATFVAMSYQTASRLGYAPAPADFTLRLSTANGIVRAAPIEIREIHLGPLVARSVKAVVSPPGVAMGDTLLGMSFLHGLGGMSIQAGRLVLSQ